MWDKKWQTTKARLKWLNSPRGIATRIYWANKRSVILAQKLKNFRGGFPDGGQNGFFIEIKRGADFIRSTQIIRFKQLETETEKPVKIHWHPTRKDNLYIEFESWYTWQQQLKRIRKTNKFPKLQRCSLRWCPGFSTKVLSKKT